MSSAIGKDAGPVAPAGPTPAELAVKAEIAEKEVRAERFRAALGQPGAQPGGQAARPGAAPAGGAQPGADVRAREATAFNRFLANDKGSGGQGAKPGAAAGKPEAGAGKASGDKPEGGTKADDLGDGLAALGGLGGAGPGGSAARKGTAGPEGGAPGADEPGVGGAGGAAGVTGKGAKTQTPGEESIVEVAAAISAAAQVPVAPSWARPEGPTQAAQRPRELPQPVPGVDPVHQLLIGKGPDGAEAKMIISVGPLAGTTINLREGPGGLQAQILTQNATTRQTLTAAMDAVALRLKGKGHNLEVRFDNTGREQQRPDQERSRR